MKQPTLKTKRLLLRAFKPSDARAVRRLAGDRLIADTTLSIPHPYTDVIAEKWIAKHPSQFSSKEAVVFAIALRVPEELVGAIGLGFQPAHQRAELGFWIGRPYWNKGYCTEAGNAVLEYGFTTRELNRIYANHFSRNPASGRVMQKIGMIHEGQARQHARKWDQFENVEWYGILRGDWLRRIRARA
jgi:RimJ/RimL family protein N-acetyltransferase